MQRKSRLMDKQMHEGLLCWQRSSETLKFNEGGFKLRKTGKHQGTYHVKRLGTNAPFSIEWSQHGVCFADGLGERTGCSSHLAHRCMACIPKPAIKSHVQRARLLFWVESKRNYSREIIMLFRKRKKMYGCLPKHSSSSRLYFLIYLLN